MKLKKILGIFLLVSVLTMSFTGCKTDEKIKIGVIQFVQHAALDAAYEGFVEALKEGGYIEGENIEIDYQNAANDQSNCQAIADKFVNDKKDLILAIATPAAQAVAMKTTEIPILVTAVTDPETAGLVVSNKDPQRNVSGTSDLTPVDKQMGLVKQILPDAKKVAILYTSSEANSVFQADLAKEAAQELGLETVDATVSNSNEIQQVVTSVVNSVDAIYVPTDNMIAAGMATVGLVANEAKVPVICGEEGMVMAGGLITYGINYENLGIMTGKMAVKVLGGEDVSKMPIEYLDAKELSITVNEDTAKAIGITIPEELLNQ
jgi:putative ABC transport system substrate-binding protein